MEDKITEIIRDNIIGGICLSVKDEDLNGICITEKVEALARQIVKEIKQPLLDIVKIDTLKLRDILIDIDYLNWNSTVIAERIANHKSQILKLKEEK